MTLCHEGKYIAFELAPTYCRSRFELGWFYIYSTLHSRSSFLALLFRGPAHGYSYTRQQDAIDAAANRLRGMCFR